MKVDVLDKGYVRLVEEGCTGSDLTVVNAARVSYAKESIAFEDRDERLINFLAREGHTSPFRHAFLQFEVYAPLMVARQWWKYVVASDHTMDAWNESSRRYITEEAIFYQPDVWRSAPENSKQGSGKPLEPDEQRHFTDELINHINISVDAYESALQSGMCAEQARLFLPAYGMYVRWYWTASVAAVANLINQRVAHDAQKEFQEYAKVVKELAETRLPHSIAALTRP